MCSLLVSLRPLWPACTLGRSRSRSLDIAAANSFAGTRLSLRGVAGVIDEEPSFDRDGGQAGRVKRNMTLSRR